MNFLIFLEFVYHALLDGIANKKTVKKSQRPAISKYTYDMKRMFSLFTCVFNHTNIYRHRIFHNYINAPALYDAGTFFSDPFHSV